MAEFPDLGDQCSVCRSLGQFDDDDPHFCLFIYSFQNRFLTLRLCLLQKCLLVSLTLDITENSL